MIAQVRRNRQYRTRHLESAQQLLQLINEVLTMAPEYNEDAMVVLPLGAILDWTMGTPAGWKGDAARRAIGIEQYQHDPQDEYWSFTSPRSRHKRSWNKSTLYACKASTRKKVSKIILVLRTVS